MKREKTNNEDDTFNQKGENDETNTRKKSMDLNNMSGFSSVYDVHTKNYFRKIKYNNQAKYRKALCKEKIELISKYFFYIFSNVINILNVAIYICLAYSEQGHNEKLTNALNTIDFLCSWYFLFEFLLINFRSHFGSLCKHILSWDSFIDVLSIVPSLIVYFIDKSKLRSILRIFKVFRVLRMYKSIKTLQYDTSIEGGILNIDHIKLQIFLIVLIFFSILFIASGCLHGLQEVIPNPFNERYLTFAECLYYVIVTATTLGYGDIFPSSIYSRLLIISIIIIFISMFSYQLTRLVQLFQLWGSYVKYTLEGHVVLLVDDTVDLSTVLREIKRDDHQQRVVIISSFYERLSSSEFPYNKVSVLHCSEIDLDVLERANAKRASYILIYTKLDFSNYERSEKVNEFIILKINQFYSNVPIYVQSLYNDKSFVTNTVIKKDDIFEFLEKSRRDEEITIKTIVPIFRIKSVIISKSMFNPGFANFAQNLICFDGKIPSDLDNYDMTMQAYLLGCENTIQIMELPACFVHQDFYEVMRQVFAKSIRDYVVKVSARDVKDVNRPVLLIGIIQSNPRATDRATQIYMFPKNQKILRKALGIFITYNGEKYLKELLRKFPNLYRIKSQKIEESDIQPFINAHKKLITQKRRCGFSEDPFELGDKEKEDGNLNRRYSFEQDKPDKYKIRPSIDSVMMPAKVLVGKTGLLEVASKDLNNSPPPEFINDKGTPVKISTPVQPLASQSNVNVEQSVPIHFDNIIQELNSIVTRRPRENSLEAYAIETPEPTNQNLISASTNDKEEEKVNSSNINNSQKRDSKVVVYPVSQDTTPVKQKPKNLLKPSKTITSLLMADKKKVMNRLANKVFKEEKSSQRDECSTFQFMMPQKTKEEIQNEKDQEFFVSKKNQILTGRDELKDTSTKKNLIFLESFDHVNLGNFLKSVKDIAKRRYRSENVLESDYFVENRIYDCAKDNVAEFLSNHILFIGYQDGLNKLLRIIQLHYPFKPVCLLTDYFFDEKIIYKYLRTFKNLYHLKGETNNPFHLINAGISKCDYIIFLVENIDEKTNTDMSKILGFRAVDYFFNTNMILELWNHSSVNLLGYNQLSKKAYVNENEFFHPLYISGSLLYLDHLNRVICMSQRDKNKVDAWIELLSLGYKTTSVDNENGSFLINNENKGYPVTITIDLPKEYVGQEFFNVFTDLICQRNPVMILGVYISDPSEYTKLRSEGRVNRLTRYQTNQLKIITSHKKNLINVNAFNPQEYEYVTNLELLKEFSYNDKTVLDYMDLRHPTFPMFITNPPPWLILCKGVKLFVLTYYEPEAVGNLCLFQREFAKIQRKEKKEYFGTGINQRNKVLLTQRQENFYQTLNVFKEKIQERYTESLKELERDAMKKRKNVYFKKQSRKSGGNINKRK